MNKIELLAPVGTKEASLRLFLMGQMPCIWLESHLALVSLQQILIERP